MTSPGGRCRRTGSDWESNDSDDLAQLLEQLDVRDVVLVGHSTGGEVARYLGKYGTEGVSKAVLLGAITPLMLRTAANPEGTPIEVFDGIRAGVAADRSQFFEEFFNAELLAFLQDG